MNAGSFSRPLLMFLSCCLLCSRIEAVCLSASFGKGLGLIEDEGWAFVFFFFGYTTFLCERDTATYMFS